MTSTIEFTAKSPERGWPPLIEWMSSQGLDPHQAKALTVDLAAMTATVVEYDLDGAGRRYLAGDEVATRAPRTVPITEPPPTRRPAPPA